MNPYCPRKKDHSHFLCHLATKLLLLFALASIDVKAETTSSPLFITASDYCLFLNSQATDDSCFFYNKKEGSDPLVVSIIREGTAGNYHYSLIEGCENKPVYYLTFSNALAYSNWLQSIHLTESDALVDSDLATSSNSFSIEPNCSSKLSMIPGTPAAGIDTGDVITDALFAVAAGVAGGRISDSIEGEESLEALQEQSNRSFHQALTHSITTERKEVTFLQKSNGERPLQEEQETSHQLTLAYQKSKEAWQKALEVHLGTLQACVKADDLTAIADKIKNINTASALSEAKMHSWKYQEKMLATGSLFHEAKEIYSEANWSKFYASLDEMKKTLVNALDTNRKALTCTTHSKLQEQLLKEIKFLQQQLDGWPNYIDHIEQEKKTAKEEALQQEERARIEKENLALQHKLAETQEALKRQKEKKNRVKKREHDRLTGIETKNKSAYNAWEEEIERSRQADEVTWLERFYHASGFGNDFTELAHNSASSVYDTAVSAYQSVYGKVVLGPQTAASALNYSLVYWKILRAEKAVKTALLEKTTDPKYTLHALNYLKQLLEELPDDKKADRKEHINQTNQELLRYQYQTTAKGLNAFNLRQVALEARDRARKVKADNTGFDKAWEEAKRTVDLSIGADLDYINYLNDIKKKKAKQRVTTGAELTLLQEVIDQASYDLACSRLGAFWCEAQQLEAIAHRLHDDVLKLKASNPTFREGWEQAMQRAKDTHKAWKNLKNAYHEQRKKLPESMHSDWNSITHRNINTETIKNNIITWSIKPFIMEAQQKDNIATVMPNRITGEEAASAWEASIERCTPLLVTLHPDMQKMWKRELQSFSQKKDCWNHWLKQKESEGFSLFQRLTAYTPTCIQEFANQSCDVFAKIVLYFSRKQGIINMQSKARKIEREADELKKSPAANDPTNKMFDQTWQSIEEKLQLSQDVWQGIKQASEKLREPFPHLATDTSWTKHIEHASFQMMRLSEELAQLSADRADKPTITSKTTKKSRNNKK